ncbi:DUF5089 domain-containing protein [Encephalitozoon hellem]|uniref:DUF5089 domain-containing protein n=1 Tax=Encephalitozoon hellem TaxID=27973 RepID=A0A9Q9F8T7_ENCHE|nr:uncharacterized protein EHEL_020870 [Encephalitozoon hellem ATCC 50504]AFM97842.1 hypothetical protein EHEL_020870 [Encephalitozoon hellem ATCC 50504]KAG5859538.1 DUF5089 domain-containing protein [Encephalitozoon hellem]UTX42621.1 DUF5089 domain-containing protein [Encephalitozoon hellem]WEL38077.1 DUF5089 domain-containing protein [Encephalitozoon hellem]|eukprot:XP_003886823.1 hypothetical protein EHEL_020870 [Encephalitozoon hellem ATCC 50504]
MGDVYSLDKAIKSKKSRGVSQDVIEEAERIEEQNYERAKGVRMQLDESALKQKATTEELMRQGETLENARKAAIGINANARRGSDITEDIEREGRVFSCELPCVRAIKRWFRGNRGNIDDIVNKKQGEEVEEGEYVPQHVEFEEEGEEYIKGQNKTDREMVGVLNTVRQIRAEADKQNKEAVRHKSIVNDISMINERSSKVIKETDQELKKVE